MTVQYMFEGKVTKNEEPTVIAHIAGNQLVLEKELFRHKISQSVNKPLIFISVIGKFQQGKTTTCKLLTGNLGHVTGNGIMHQTDGVTIDGPYSTQHLFDFYQINPSVNFGETSPDVYIFDIEGYDANKTPELYQQLCVPFIGISSMLIVVFSKNEGASSIQIVNDTFYLSKISSPNANDNANILQLMLCVRDLEPDNFASGCFNEINHENLRRSAEELKNTMDLNPMNLNGISMNVFCWARFSDKENFKKSFEYFAENVLKKIEDHSASNHVRDADATMNHFNVICDSLNNANFQNLVNQSMQQQQNSTINKFINISADKAEANAKEIINNAFIEFNSRSFSENEINELYERIPHEIISMFDRFLFIGLMNDPIANDKRIQLQDIVRTYIREKERRLYDDYAPRIVGEIYSSTLTNLDQRIMTLKERLRDKAYFCIIYNDEQTFGDEMIESIKSEYLTNIENVIGSQINYYQSLIEPNINTFNGLIRNKINTSFQEFYGIHSSQTCTTNSEDCGSFTRISTIQTKYDPFGNVISSICISSQDVAKPVIYKSKNIFQKVGGLFDFF